MKAATRPRKPSSKSRRKKRRVSLTLGSNGRAPTLVTARSDGVEAMALEQAGRLGLATAGFVPSGTRNPGDSFLATPTRHPSQALKWNVRAADVSVLITPDAQLYGRALLAQPGLVAIASPGCICIRQPLMSSICASGCVPAS